MHAYARPVEIIIDRSGDPNATENYAIDSQKIPDQTQYFSPGELLTIRRICVTVVFLIL